jgi:DNA helicase-2/ATP-dependent DNA helicase PcrA
MDGTMQAQAKEAQGMNDVRAAARQLLAAFREHSLAWEGGAGEIVPLDELATWLGLEVATFSPDDYPPGTFGFLEPEERLIWLRRDLPFTLYRFTLAHELGHAILHRRIPLPAQPTLTSLQAGYKAFPFDDTGRQDDAATPEDPCQEEDVRETLAAPAVQQAVEDMLGPGILDAIYDPHSQRELDANLFAAELLMPLERVRTCYLSQDIPPERLADLFGVSLAAMLNRLSELVIGDRAVTGDYKGPSPTAPPSSLQGVRGDRQYDRYQRAAIEAPTPALIVAGPGSGKTSTLIGRAEYLIHERGVQPQHILALTFSRKAAQEMQERLQQALTAPTSNHQGPSSSPVALPTVSTFHAFCAGLLREYGGLVGLRRGFAFIDDAEGYFLLRRLGARLPLRHYQNLANPAASFPAILSAISRAKDELVTPAMYRQLAQAMLDQARAMQEAQGAESKQAEEELERAEKALEIAGIYELYQQQLEQHGDTDFGGLIMLAVQLLRDHPDVRAEVQERYQHILVDEFQDINRASGVLLRLLAGEARRVWVVGDANQAIYAFRGASPANIANFREDYPDAVILPLSRNYRSLPDIVTIAESFRRARLEPEGSSSTMTAESARPAHADASITLASAPDEESELHGIVEDIRRKHAQGYAYRDIVVLCRTRALARKVTRALVRAGLPVIERGGMLEQEHIRALISTIMLLTASGAMGILRTARQPDHPFTQADIEALLLATRETQEGEPPASLRQILLSGHAPPGLSLAGQQSFARLSAILKTLYFTPAINSIWLLLAHYLFIASSIGRSLLASDAGGTRFIASWPSVEHNPKDAMNHVPPTASNEALRADYADLLALARYFDAQQQSLRLLQAEQPGDPPATPPVEEQVKVFLDYLTVLLTLHQDGGGSRREAEQQDGGEAPDVIRVMTVHASKGLEFPVVYLPGVVNQKFPSQRRWQPAPPPRGMIASGDDEVAAHEIGEACLFYVAATRARDHLIISYAERYGKRSWKPSSYIHALAADLSNERIIRMAWPKASEEGARTNGNEEAYAGIDLDGLSPSQPGEAFIAASTPATLHISAIETYQRCPRQYMYGFIYRFRGEAAAYQHFRKAAQLTLDDLQARIGAARAGGGDEQPEVRYPTEEEARALYSQHWRASDGHITPFAPLYEQHGHEVAELLRRKLLASSSAGWQLSQTFTVEVAGQPIEVTVDRVETQGEKESPRFVKTGYGRRKTKVDPTARELLYARAYQQQHPNRPIELHFHNMSTGETFEIKLTQKKEQSLYQELEKALGGMSRHEYPPKPDAQVCPVCPFFLICPA